MSSQLDERGLMVGSTTTQDNVTQLQQQEQQEQIRVVEEKDYLHVFECIPCNIQISADDDCDEDEIGLQVCNCKTLKHGKCCFDESCLNVATQTECMKCSSNCANKNFSTSSSRRTTSNLQVIQTNQKGFGLVTSVPMSIGTFVIEFVGELINETDLLQRIKDFDGHLLSMQLKDGTFIDATKKGSISRFLNHSCDPNCRIEVWSVNKKYRVGVFAIKSIDPGTELTIDYEWEPSAKGLTTCYCKSVYCRGYIEKLSDPSLKRLYTMKTGLWLPRKEVPTEALNENLCIDPMWMINKRIKVFWDGNQSWLEADIKGFDPKKGMHQIQYVVEYSVVDELLPLTTNDLTSTVSGSEWMWLDESREEESIRKRIRSEIDSSEVNPESEPSVSSRTTTETTGPQIPVQRLIVPSLPSYLKKVKRVIQLQDSVALRIVAKKRSPESLSADYLVFKEATDILSAECSVTIVINDVVEASLNQHIDTLNFTVWGTVENVSKVVDAIESIQSTLAREDSDQLQKALHFVRQHQPLVLSKDWRTYVPCEDCITFSLSSDLALVSNLHSKLLSLPPRKGYLSSKIYSELMSKSSSVNQPGVYHFIWNAAIQNILNIVIKVGRGIGIPRASILHTVCLLLRLSQYLNTCVDYNDVVVTTVAIILLSLKARGDFKSKFIQKLIIKAYCDVYNRDEGSCNSDLCSLFEDKVFAKEHNLFQKLEYDTYIKDIISTLHASLAEDESVTSLSQIESVTLLKQFDRCTALGLELCLMFVTQFPCLFVMVEPEMLLCGSIIFACTFQTILLESRIGSSSQSSLISLLIPIAVHSMGTSVIGLHCVVEVLAAIATHFLIEFKSAALRLAEVENENISALLYKISDSTLTSMIQSVPVAFHRFSTKVTSTATVGVPSIERALEHGDVERVVTERLFRRLHLGGGKEEALNFRQSQVSDNKLLSEDFETCSVPNFNSSYFLQALADNGRISCGIRSWPTSKQLHRESKSLSRHSYDCKKSLSALALTELNMLQHLQDCTGYVDRIVQTESSHNPSDDNDMTSCPFVANPIGVAEFQMTDGAFVPAVYSSHSSKSHGGDTNSRDGISRYHLVVSPARCSLQSLLPFISNGHDEGVKASLKHVKPLTLSLDFVTQLSKDMFSIVLHCSKSGLYFKWITLDSVMISKEGRLILSGLDGCVFAKSNYNEPASTKQSSRDSRGGSHKPAVPHSMLSTSSPETVLGAPADRCSSSFIAAVICVYILTGKTLFKSGNSEEKYLQYLFRILGSPEANNFTTEYLSFPLAKNFSIDVKGGDKNRAAKIITGLCPSHLTDNSDTSAAFANLIKIISGPLHLVPRKRTMPTQILNFLLSASNDVQVRTSGLRDIKSMLNRVDMPINK